MRVLALLAALAVAAVARADCPHQPPTEGSRCDRAASTPCAFHGPNGSVICTCRDGGWHCEIMPPPPS